jgi:hypothetical protein
MDEQGARVAEEILKNVRAGAMDASLPKTTADAWLLALADVRERLLGAVRGLDRRVKPLENDRDEGDRATAGLR